MKIFFRLESNLKKKNEIKLYEAKVRKKFGVNSKKNLHWESGEENIFIFSLRRNGQRKPERYI